MTISQTECSDMQVWLKQEWKLSSPLNVVLQVEAPAFFGDFVGVEPQETRPGDYAIIWPRREQNMDSVTHHALMEESLREYSDIWRTLAGK